MPDIKNVTISGVIASQRTFAYDDAVVKVTIALPSGKSMVCLVCTLDEWDRDEIGQVTKAVEEVKEFAEELIAVGLKDHRISVEARGWC